MNIETLKANLNYDPETGVFTWAKGGSRRKVGGVAGYDKGNGYMRVEMFGKAYPLHRLAWMYVHGAMPECEVDHINGCRGDNRISNLRLASHSENKQNMRKPRSDNTTGFLGVSRSYGKYCAQICINGKKKFLGYFDSAIEASRAYVEAKRELHAFCTI